MHRIVENLLKINEKVKRKFESTSHLTNLPKIIAVSKTFKIEHIKPLIDYGHDHYGENKVQEAQEKWTSVKEKNKNIKLHLIGRLQSNKVKLALKLFDYIHSLDSKKLADIFSKCEAVSGKNLKYFIQVNIGAEEQKSGISISEVEQFYDYCKKEKKLNILGLMAIPPNDHKTREYFKTLNELNLSLGLKELSMGMSSDYEEAVKQNATFVRIGSSIFGQRS